MVKEIINILMYVIIFITLVIIFSTIANNDITVTAFIISQIIVIIIAMSRIVTNKVNRIKW